MSTAGALVSWGFIELDEPHGLFAQNTLVELGYFKERECVSGGL